MTFKIGWVFAEVQILFKFKDYCKMTFIIGRGFAERQNSEKVKMALSLELSGIYW